LLLFGDLPAVFATPPAQTSDTFIYLPLVMDQYSPPNVTNVADLISSLRLAGGNCSNPFTINLATGTYTLTSVESGYDGLPVITCDVTINGNNSTIKRDNAAPDFRIFEVASRGRLTLNDVTISGGSTTQRGGAINNGGGTLNINHSTFSGNAAILNSGSDDAIAGAIYNGGGTVNISNSTFSRNSAYRWSGGIRNDLNGILTVTHTNFTNNDGGAWGGGIDNNSGSATVTDSVFSSNTANFGGGIVNNSSLTIIGSTFSSNEASGRGGAVLNQGILTIKDSLLIANLGGAIYNNGSLASIHNSCIVANTLNPETGRVIFSNGSTSLIATNNWWGEPDGPSGAGPGSGDSVSTNVVFNPFLTSALPGCPTGPFVTSIDINPSNLSVPVNEQLQISATVNGIGNFSHEVQWSVLSGNGTISSNTGTSIIFFAPSITDVTTIHAVSIADPTKSIDIKVNTADISISVDPHAPVKVLVNQSVQVFGGVMFKNYSEAVFPIDWSLNGPGTLDLPTRWDNSTLFGPVYHAPSVPGQSVIRISLSNFPNHYLDVPIDVISNGPVSCANTSGILFGDADGWGRFRVSQSGIQPNWPTVSNFNYENPFDPIPGETRAVNLRAYVKSPAIDPITNVNITFETDNSTFGPYPMILDTTTGNGFDGYWRWEGSLPDSICYNYIARVELINAAHTTLMSPAPRSR
jgi:hypothetical protein